MRVLVLGGTRFFGIPMIRELLAAGHEVTVATRGRTPDPFGADVKRLTLDRTEPESMRQALSGRHFDVVIDKIAYCSNDIRSAIEVLDCDRYIYMSSTAVFEPKRMDTREEDFDPLKKELIWCSRQDFPYDEVKRQAECALWQSDWAAAHQAVAVRYPFVIGPDDYTKRLLFYVEHTMRGMPMYIDNIDRQMGYIRSDEAGKFLAFLVDRPYVGAVNGCSAGTISLREIIAYVEEKTGTKAVLADTGERAPYNGEVEYSINTDRAAALGFRFSRVRQWIFDLLDDYIAQLR
ncbi:MAG: NAD-dependent epimerase/dehydratase family protein [Christensenellaceae bacterium]|nr:NAD-dependent epimerase/dehydratase family protein [Christensenellaceae bacterium]